MNDDRPTNVRRMVFVLGCVTSWMLYLHRYTFGLIKPSLTKEGMTATELGQMDACFSTAYASVQLPTGLLGDFVGVHWLLGALILLWSVALALHAWAPDARVLYVARAMLGAAQAGVFSLIGRLTRSWFPARVRTTAQGWIAVFSGRMGGLSANLLFLTLMIGVLKIDWRIALYFLAGLGILHGLAFLALFRNSPAEHPRSNVAEAELVGEALTSDSPKRATLRQLFSRMSVRSIVNLLVINISSTFSSIADQLFSNWIPLFLFQVYALDSGDIGMLSALPLLGGACGGVVGGYLSDYLIRRTGNRRWVRSLVGASGKTLAAITLACAIVFFYDEPKKFCGMLLVVKFFADISLASRWGTVTDIGGRVTASVFAFNNSIASLLSGMFAMVYGMVSDDFGWKPVLWIGCGAYVACAATWLLVNCTIPVLADDRESED